MMQEKTRACNELLSYQKGRERREERRGAGGEGWRERRKKRSREERRSLASSACLLAPKDAYLTMRETVRGDEYLIRAGPLVPRGGLCP